jgi:hypothetical protein
VKERYVPIRPGISDHLLRGDLSVFEFGVYVLIHLQADFRTGVWQGSAPRILHSAPRGAKLRDIQRALERLTDLGFLKHFHQQGQRGNFAVLINKFTVRSGALTGLRLNADKSASWSNPVYDACADADADDGAEAAPIQEVRSKKKEETKPPASADPIELETKQAAFDLFWEKFPRKQDKASARRAWWKIPLAEYPPLMAALEKFLTCDQWRRGVIPHASTWLNKKRWQDEDIPQVPIGGSSHGHKPSTNDSIEVTLATMRARAASQNRPN